MIGLSKTNEILLFLYKAFTTHFYKLYTSLLLYAVIVRHSPY